MDEESRSQPQRAMNCDCSHLKFFCNLNCYYNGTHSESEKLHVISGTPEAGPYVHRNSFETGTGFRFFNSCSVSNEISGHFSCSNRAGKKMEQDFERIHGSKSRISQIQFLFGGIPVYIRTGLILLRSKQNAKSVILSKEIFSLKRFFVPQR